MNDPLKQFNEKDANRIRSSSARNYVVGFSVAVGRTLGKRGEEDGIAAAASMTPAPPDPVDVHGEREYRIGYAAAFERAMKARGEADGAAAAAAFDIDVLGK